jgi:hypothetical protein
MTKNNERTKLVEEGFNKRHAESLYFFNIWQISIEYTKKNFIDFLMERSENWKSINFFFNKLKVFMLNIKCFIFYQTPTTSNYISKYLKLSKIIFP